MGRLITYITFIPWLLNYGVNIRNAIRSTKSEKITKKWLKNNLAKMIHVESLLLISIFIYFTKFDNNTVNKMLFSVMNIYFFINTFYDKRVDTRNKTEVNDISTILITIILSFIPLIIFLKTNNLALTYLIDFAYVFFSYIVVITARKIDNLINKFFAGRKNE